jgi:hypothetical protein
MLQIKVRASRCPFGQIDNRKLVLGRFRFHFQKKMLTCGLKEDIKAFLFLRVRPHGSSIAQELSSFENSSHNVIIR